MPRTEVEFLRWNRLVKGVEETEPRLCRGISELLELSPDIVQEERKWLLMLRRRRWIYVGNFSRGCESRGEKGRVRDGMFADPNGSMSRTTAMTKCSGYETDQSGDKRVTRAIE